MEQFWQQDRLILSVEIFAILAGMLAVSALAILISQRLQGPFLRLKTGLKHPHSILIFKFARILLSLIGIVTLVVTLLPGLMPFADRVDLNLELGGIILFFLWPLIALQVTIGFLPIEQKLEPELAWGALIVCFLVGLNICKIAVSLVYN